MSKSSRKSAATIAADALAASHGTTSPATGAQEKPVSKSTRKSAKPAQGALALVTPAVAADTRADDASFDPTFLVGGVVTHAPALAVGVQGTCHPDALFVPPAGHSRHDPRSLVERSPEFRADVAANGIDQPVAVFVLDGRVEVLDGRGRIDAARACGREVPFIVRPVPADALAARMSASRLNALRLPVDPVAQGALFTEALDAGLTPEAVAAAMGVPASTVRRLVRVVAQGDEATKALLSDGVITDGAALTLTQQTPEVRAEVIEGVEALVAAAVEAAAPVAPVTGSQKGDAKPDAKSKRGATVTQTAVEALRDAAKGREVKAGGKDAAKAGAAKRESDGVARPDAKRDPMGERDLRLARIRRNALATLASGTASEVERAYAQGLLDAVAVVFTGEGLTPVAGHPAPALAVALVRMPAGYEAGGERLARIVGQ